MLKPDRLFLFTLQCFYSVNFDSDLRLHCWYQICPRGYVASPGHRYQGESELHVPSSGCIIVHGICVTYFMLLGLTLACVHCEARIGPREDETLIQYYDSS